MISDGKIMNAHFTCVICGANHDLLWSKHYPSMYCGPCAVLKRAAKGVVTHVIDTLYLGDIFAAKTFDGERLCVHENPEYASMHHIPILTILPNSALDRTGAIASIAQLDKVVDFIINRLRAEVPLIVHCKGGVERSPLAIAYFLVKAEQDYSTLDDAYKYLKSIRPVVSDRTFWLP